MRMRFSVCYFSVQGEHNSQVWPTIYYTHLCVYDAHNHFHAAFRVCEFLIFFFRATARPETNGQNSVRHSNVVKKASLGDTLALPFSLLFGRFYVNMLRIVWQKYRKHTQDNTPASNCASFFICSFCCAHSRSWMRRQPQNTSCYCDCGTLPTSTCTRKNFRTHLPLVCWLHLSACATISYVGVHSIYGTLVQNKNNKTKKRQKHRISSRNKEKINGDEVVAWRTTRLLTCCNATKILYYCYLARALAHFYAIYVYPCALLSLSLVSAVATVSLCFIFLLLFGFVFIYLREVVAFFWCAFAHTKQTKNDDERHRRRHDKVNRHKVALKSEREREWCRIYSLVPILLARRKVPKEKLKQFISILMITMKI